ncbi:DASH complex subunit dad4 [Friedmanniomyces endolithicus]|nr:DASH complex subunit dad4 [Friedmanniomyces endolithicus]KAK1824564.1 DASH complex subunit dad4 [Friedmanniomyces endolithicus]
MKVGSAIVPYRHVLWWGSKRETRLWTSIYGLAHLSHITDNMEKLNEAIVVLNRSLQEINVQNMNVELVAQMFQNYQSNVLFHLEGTGRFIEDAYIKFQYTDAAWEQRRTA